jgi:hypothetical protein
MRYCPNCGALLDDRAEVCDKCKTEQPIMKGQVRAVHPLPKRWTPPHFFARGALITAVLVIASNSLGIMQQDNVIMILICATVAGAILVLDHFKDDGMFS